MSSRTERLLVGLVLAWVALLLLLAFIYIGAGRWYAEQLISMKATDWAAWAQAAGPILAFLAAWVLMRFERAYRQQDEADALVRRRSDERVVLREQLRHIALTCHTSHSRLTTYEGAFDSEQEMKGLLLVFTDVLDSIRAMNLMNLADPELAALIARLRLCARDTVLAITTDGDVLQALETTGVLAGHVLERLNPYPAGKP